MRTIEKADLRRSAKARRNALDPRTRDRACARIAIHADTWLADSVAGRIVGGLLPIGSEIDLRPLMGRLRERGARLALPCIENGDLVFRAFESDAALVPQGFGTLGPARDAEPLDPAILLVPMLAFDRRGGRIGYGRGYYDRAIERLTDQPGGLSTLGVAFAAQEVDEVPMEASDRFLQAVVTENGVLVPNASASVLQPG